MTRILVGTVLMVLLSGCGVAASTRPSPVPPPSASEALAFLASIEAEVKSGDLSHLCEKFGGGTCRHTLQGSDPAAVPTTDPAVIGTSIIPPATYADGTWSDGGRLLELCGVDGLGKHYYSEMLVFNDGGRTISVEPAYWIGVRIATSGTVSSSVPPSPPCPI
jgi:hypothetical protein